MGPKDVERVYKDGFEALEPAQRVAVLKSPGFDYWHYLKSLGALKDCWPAAQLADFSKEVGWSA